MDYQKYRDELTRDETIYEGVHHVSEPLNFAFGIDYYIKDSIVAKTAKGMDYLLDRVSSKISRKLLKDIKVHNEDRFLVHYDVKIKHLAGTRSKRGENKMTQYLPFTLRLSDGQILTALVANTSQEEFFKGKQEVEVVRWALNNKDITSFIYPNGDRNIDSSDIANRLAKVINSIHIKFIKKNPNANIKVKTLEELEELDINKANIVWTKEPKQPKKDPQIVIPKVEDDEPDLIIEGEDIILDENYIKLLDAHARKLDDIIVEKRDDEWYEAFENFFDILEKAIFEREDDEPYITKLFMKYNRYIEIDEKR